MTPFRPPIRGWMAALAALLSTAGAQPQAPRDNPRAIVEQAKAAVEGDSADLVRDRWLRLLRRPERERAALLMIGAIARLTYDFGEADARMQRLVAIARDDAFADYAQIELGVALMLRGRVRDAEAAYTRALTGAERRGDSIAVADALLQLATPRSRSAPMPEVFAMIDRAERLGRGDPLTEADARCQRAALLVRTGAPNARQLAWEGAAIARRVRNRRQEGRCLHAVAQDFANRGLMDSAGTVLDSTKRLFEAARDRASLAAVLQWRGYLFNSLTRYGDARAELVRAIDEGERAKVGSVVGWSYLNLGMISLGLGDRITAAEQLQRAVSLLESQRDDWGVVTARAMLGGVARERGDLAVARAAYTSVLRWADSTNNVLIRYNMHDALGSIDRRQHNYAAAAMQLDSARAIARAHGMQGREAGLAVGQAQLALRLHDYTGAARLLSAALPGLDTAQHAPRYELRTLLAEAYARQGSIDRAESELVAASADLDSWRASLPERQLRVLALEAFRDEDSGLGLATVIGKLAKSGRVESAFQLAERQRARELLDAMLRAEAARSTRGTGASTTPHFVTNVRQASAAAPSLALLDDSTALLEYVSGRGSEPTTLFMVTRSGIRARELVALDSLDDDLERFATLLEVGDAPRALSARLGAALLDPAADSLDPRITRLVLVAEGALARVPFDALVLRDGKYAIERFAIAAAPSAATFFALRARPPSQQPMRVLAFGDPTFTRRPTPNDTAVRRDDAAAAMLYRSAFADRGGLPRLAGSAREARMVSRYAPRSDVRVGDDASEAFLRGAPLDSFRVLHFATHALVDEEAITRTALALAPGHGYDGFLGPADLAALPLNADLVVLSSCRTARGVAVRGEGVQGLTAPLLEAGARSVVATEWRIDDARTVRLVDALYRELATGLPLVDALRAAKLAALREGAPANEWAAFVALGDPLVRVPLLPPADDMARTWWSLGAAAVALALALPAAAYRRAARKRAGAERG
jgi:CHAT domain-containing protein/tetratricopeptide (TPR) repeat protein